MSIRLPRSRLIDHGAGQWIDTYTGSGLAVRSFNMTNPVFTPNGTLTEHMRAMSQEIWVNRCTTDGKLIQVCRFSLKTAMVTRPFTSGPIGIVADSELDPNGLVVGVAADVMPLLTTLIEHTSANGYSIASS